MVYDLKINGLKALTMVENKRILKDIAKRFAKAIVIDSAQEAFSETGLTIEEEYYIIEQLKIIANRITDLPVQLSTETLVNEYFD